MSAQQHTLDGDLAAREHCNHYQVKLSEHGQIVWDVGRDCDFDDVADELAEVHRRWVEAGLSEVPDE